MEATFPPGPTRTSPWGQGGRGCQGVLLSLGWGFRSHPGSWEDSALLPTLPLGPEECSPVDRAPTSVSLITPRCCVCRSLIATISVFWWQHSFKNVDLGCMSS